MNVRNKILILISSKSFHLSIRFQQVPHIDSLFKLIVENNPFEEIYNLGNRKQYIDKDELILEIVSSGEYKNYKKVK